MAKTFTAGIDNLLGTDADDTFQVLSGADVGPDDSLDGGQGNDTLEIVNGGTIDLSVLAKMTGIEAIKGSVSGDTITLSSAQMLGIASLDGDNGIDNLRLTGATFNLTGKVIESFEKITLADGVREVTTNDFEVARLIDATESQNDTLNFTGGVLSEAQRQELFDHGIDKIIEQDGTVINVNRAPVMAGLSGNSVITVPNGSVLLDDGTNMTLGGEDGDLFLLQILCQEVAGNGASEFSLDILTQGTGISLSDGVNPGSEITIDGVKVGVVNDLSDSQLLWIDFFGTATRALVEKLIRAVAFSNSSVENADAIYRYEVKFHIEDNGGRASDAIVKVMVAPGGTPIDNAAPSNVTIDGQKSIIVDESLAVGAVIGTLGADDEHPEKLTYSFASGGDGGGRFVIEDNQIKVKGPLDYEGPSLDRDEKGFFFYSLKVVATDSAQDPRSSTPEEIRIYVNDVNEAALGIQFLDLKKIKAGVTAAGTQVVLAAAIDPDMKQEYKQNLFRIVDGDPDGIFKIDPATGQIKTNKDLTSADVGKHVLTIEVYDAGRPAFVYSKQYEITVLPEGNTAPDVPFALQDPLAVDEEVAGQTVVATVTADDIDHQTLTYSLVNTFGGKFSINETTGEITLNGPVDFETDTDLVPEPGTGRKYFYLQVKASDGELTSEPGIVKVYINDVIENVPPQKPVLAGSSISESAGVNAVVGVLSAADPGDSVHYVLVDNPGGYFAIVGNELRVAKALDFETAQTHRITVKAVDSQGASSSEATFTITVGDVLETVAGATKGKDVLTGGIGADKLNGGYGNDVLTGGAGADIFVFDSKLGTATTDRKVNFDTITDFTVGEDKIWLDNAVFKKLGKGSEAAPGKLNKKFFVVGDKAKDKDDYLIYNKKTGILSYDADGSGKGQAVEFAKLSKNLKLSVNDFLIV